MDHDIGFADFLAVLIRKRRLILAVGALGVLIGAAIYLLSLFGRPKDGGGMIEESRLSYAVYNDAMALTRDFSLGDDAMASAMESAGVSWTTAGPISTGSGTSTRPMGDYGHAEASMKWPEFRETPVPRVSAMGTQLDLAVVSFKPGMSALFLESLARTMEEKITDYNRKLDECARIQAFADDPAVIANEHYILAVRVGPLATVERALTRPRPSLRLPATIAVAGFIIALAAAFISAWLDTFIRDPENRRIIHEAIKSRKAEGRE